MQPGADIFDCQWLQRPPARLASFDEPTGDIQRLRLVALVSAELGWPGQRGPRPVKWCKSELAWFSLAALGGG
jgi:hypothetical protein